MNQEQDQDKKYIVEVYKQTSDWARAYMNLRLKHFAAFSVILFFLTTAAFKIDKLKDYTGYIIIIGIAITMLFWILDYRTSEYLKCYINYSKKLENTLVGETISLPNPKFLKASMVTNLIFVIVLAIWIAFLVIYGKNTADHNFKDVVGKNEMKIVKKGTGKQNHKIQKKEININTEQPLNK